MAHEKGLECFKFFQVALAKIGGDIDTALLDQKTSISEILKIGADAASLGVSLVHQWRSMTPEERADTRLVLEQGEMTMPPGV